MGEVRPLSEGSPQVPEDYVPPTASSPQASQPQYPEEWNLLPPDLRQQLVQYFTEHCPNMQRILTSEHHHAQMLGERMHNWTLSFIGCFEEPERYLWTSARKKKLEQVGDLFFMMSAHEQEKPSLFQAFWNEVTDHERRYLDDLINALEPKRDTSSIKRAFYPLLATHCLTRGRKLSSRQKSKIVALFLFEKAYALYREIGFLDRMQEARELSRTISGTYLWTKDQKNVIRNSFSPHKPSIKQGTALFHRNVHQFLASRRPFSHQRYFPSMHAVQKSPLLSLPASCHVSFQGRVFASGFSSSPFLTTRLV